MADLKTAVQKLEQGEASDTEIGDILSSVQDTLTKVDQLASEVLESGETV